jgi:hypothetical protein
MAAAKSGESQPLAAITSLAYHRRPQRLYRHTKRSQSNSAAAMKQSKESAENLQRTEKSENMQRRLVAKISAWRKRRISAAKIRKLTAGEKRRYR